MEHSLPRLLYAAHAAFDLERLALEAALRHALARDEFSLVYQPQVDVASGEILGVEALLRWNHPTLGPVSPDRFIPVAEEVGLIGQIGDWVMRTACAKAGAWQREGLGSIRMMFDVSPVQLRQGDLAVRMARVLLESGLDPCRVGIELTESVVIQHLEDAAAQLGSLRDLGVKIALDDSERAIPA